MNIYNDPCTSKVGVYSSQIYMRKILMNIKKGCITRHKQATIYAMLSLSVFHILIEIGMLWKCRLAWSRLVILRYVHTYTILNNSPCRQTDPNYIHMFDSLCFLWWYQIFLSDTMKPPSWFQLPLQSPLVRIFRCNCTVAIRQSKILFHYVGWKYVLGSTYSLWVININFNYSPSLYWFISLLVYLCTFLHLPKRDILFKYT